MSPALLYADNSEVALEKAKEAALIQSGVQKFIDNLKNYGTKEIHNKLIKFGVEKEIAGCLYTYKVIRDRSISFPISRKRITVGDKYVKLSIPL